MKTLKQTQKQKIMEAIDKGYAEVKTTGEIADDILKIRKEWLQEHRNLISEAMKRCDKRKTEANTPEKRLHEAILYGAYAEARHQLDELIEELEQ